MKNSNSLTTSLIALIAILLVHGCGVDQKNESPCPECPSTELADENYDNGIIFPERARKLYDNYEERRVKIIEDFERSNEKQQKSAQTENPDGQERSFKVARYVSFNYDDLKKYLAYIENEAKLSGEKLSTMRFYFANYANERKFEDGKPVLHPRQNSVMMSPTVHKNGEDHIFYTIDGKDGKRQIVLLENDFKERKDSEPNNEKEEASFLPSYFFSSKPFMFSPRSTTKNEGSSHP